jgi:hypothetical protein
MHSNMTTSGSNTKSAEIIVKHVEEALKKTDNDQPSKLHPKIFEITGFSGQKTKKFLNYLLEFPTKNANYLDIGSHQGSTFVSAMYKNEHINGIAIDNYSEFGDHEAVFNRNAIEFLDSDCVEMINLDCLYVHPDRVRPIDVFFYDGSTSCEIIGRVIVHFWSALNDVAVVLVDDWNWPHVREGAREGMAKSGANVLFSREIVSEKDSDAEGYWNGLAVFVVKKN